jgi:Zn-dependent peptidase ImmA (M78 family)/transcriptional regulator with XRE-family HTH domain
MGSFLSPEMNEIFITGDVVVWARERRGLSQIDLAKQMKVSAAQIADWETGITAPQYAKAQKLADTLKIPFGFLFFSTRPSDDIPLPDFRTIDELVRRKLSVDAIEHINNVLLKQEWYREHAEREGHSPLPFVKSFSTSDDPDEVADSISNALGISPALRRSSGSWRGYLSKLIAAAEAKGILVIRTGIVKSSTKRSLSVADFRGFAISDSLAPLVAINAKDSVAARIFSVIHEIAHIWLGSEGISNSDGADSKSTLPIEKFCNTVAVRVLVPLDQFSDLWNTYHRESDRIDKLALAFKVSSIVIVRRAYEAKKISHPEFLRLLHEARANQRPVKTKPGGNPEKNIRARNSGLVTDAAIMSVRLGRLVYRDASRLLGTSISYIAKITGKKVRIQ